MSRPAVRLMLGVGVVGTGVVGTGVVGTGVVGTGVVGTGVVGTGVVGTGVVGTGVVGTGVVGTGVVGTGVVSAGVELCVELGDELRLGVDERPAGADDAAVPGAAVVNTGLVGVASEPRKPIGAERDFRCPSTATTVGGLAAGAGRADGTASAGDSADVAGWAVLCSVLAVSTTPPPTATHTAARTAAAGGRVAGLRPARPGRAARGTPTE